MKLYVIGAGVGDADFLTGLAKKILSDCDIIITTKRLYGRLCGLSANIRCMELMEFIPFLERCQAEKSYESAAVLASGDVGFYSVAKALKESFPFCEFISGISSLQYLTAKLGYGYDDVKTVSLHGRGGSIVPFVCYNRRVFALTGGEKRAGGIIGDLVAAGLGEVTVTVGENLSDESERIITGRARELQGAKFGNLAVIFIENNNAVDPCVKLYDEDFIRAEKIPMTKEAVRTLTVSYLDIRAGDTVVDIGAGSGSVCIEMARKAHEGTVFAVEKSPVAVNVLQQNIAKFGAYNTPVISAEAPNGLSKLPPCDKAFIGGSGGNLAQIITALVEKNPKIRIAVNAVTLETLAEARLALSANGFKARISCINAAHAESLGGYSLMKAENPVYIIVGEKCDGDV